MSGGQSEDCVVPRSFPAFSSQLRAAEDTLALSILPVIFFFNVDPYWW